MRIKKIIFFVTALFFIIIYLWGDNISLPMGRKSNELDSIDINEELQEVINYYSKENKDSLKLKAALFLINNIYDKYHFESYTLNQYDSIVGRIEKPNVVQLRTILDSLKSIYGDSIKIKKDIDIVTSELMIENIEFSFKAWELPWANFLSFDQFCEYILPYKSSKERPIIWRQKVFKKYIDLIDSTKSIKSDYDIISVCSELNQIIADEYKISLNYSYPVDMNYDQALTIKSGDCASATKFTLYPFRALGIPVVVDFTPYWANRSLGHYWNTLLFPNGSVSCFVGTESNPGKMKIEFVGPDRMKFKRSKVFRKTYAIQYSSLAKVRGKEDVPDFFKDPHFIDVTSSYFPVSDIVLNVSHHKDKNFAYLMTFDNRNWRPVHWAEIKDGKIRFKDMGRDVVYLPVVYSEQTFTSISPPLKLDKSGKLEILDPNKDVPQTIEILKKYPEDLSNNIVPGDTYEVFYWDKGWISLGAKKAENNKLVYNQAPSNALFWVRNLDRGKQERIFTYANEKQIWW